MFQTGHLDDFRENVNQLDKQLCVYTNTHRDTVYTYIIMLCIGIITFKRNQKLAFTISVAVIIQFSHIEYCLGSIFNCLKFELRNSRIAIFTNTLNPLCVIIPFLFHENTTKVYLT